MTERGGMEMPEPGGPGRGQWPLLSQLRELGDDLEGNAPELDASVAARLREAAQARGLLHVEATSGTDLQATGRRLEEESPPFDAEAGAARLRQAAESRGLLPAENAAADSREAASPGNRESGIPRPAAQTERYRLSVIDTHRVMRIGAARMTAGLDSHVRLDLQAHLDVFGPLPRLTTEELISMTAQVDLRGQGGEAFPFARKLKAVAQAAKATDEPPVVVINAIEGDPGGVRDKMLMIRSPYLILSGAALVAEAISAEEVIVGVAGDELANRSIEAAIATEPGLRAMVRVVQIPDRLVSGESGALIRGINGKRPVPPSTEMQPTESGVDGLPTLLSNASTFAQIAVLALLGPERFASVGVPEEPGTVLLSVSGSAKHAAVVECPTGVPLGAVLDICQAPVGDGVLVGGYHGMWLDAETAYQVPVGREGLASAGGTFGSGIVLPLGHGTCPLGEVSRIASYLAGESSGQCGPCKLGLPSIARALAAIIDGSGGIEALDAARRAAAAVNGRGACSHPDGTTRFVLSALEVFTEDLAAHVFHSTCGRPVRGMLPLPETAEAKQLTVDWVRCEGHGLCAHLVPELIHRDKTGFPVILPIPVPPWLEKDAQDAVQMCPTQALRLSQAMRPSASTGPVTVPVPSLRSGLIGTSGSPAPQTPPGMPTSVRGQRDPSRADSLLLAGPNRL